MRHHIRSAAVIGSGVMGASIAAHLANAGVRTLLLDIVPELTAQDQDKGWTRDNPAFRNRLATDAIRRLQQAKPAPLYDNAFAARITPGNMEDDLPRLAEVDWIIEAVTERLDVKQQVYAQIEQVWRSGTIVSSNTSGISIEAMMESCSEEMKSHFLGTHFFNPPRYMKLLEMIPGAKTQPDIVETVANFAESKLGKGIVFAKDTPNFIANRIGTYGLLVILQEMEAGGWTVEEIDAVTGPAMGRPKSATFRTLDLVGLDTFIHVAHNVRDRVDDPVEKAMFQAPRIMETLVSRGWLGEKSGQGFYKKIKTSQGSQILSLRAAAMEYEPSAKPASASLQAAKLAKGAKEKTRALLGTGDRYSALAWNVLKKVLIYAAEKVGEIADSIADIDQAMKWGFNWELGPFELWDAIGIASSVQRMEDEGLTVPQWVKDWLDDGNESFYKTVDGAVLGLREGALQPLARSPRHISLSSLKASDGPATRHLILSNSGASLIDIGDGVACLEFHSPNNAIGADILSMIQQGLDIVRDNYEGMVIANEGRHFCVGANLMLLLMEAQDEEWDEVDAIIRLFQSTMMKLKYFEKPIVAAPHRMTLGGGVEVCLPADTVCASAETYYGLVEVGVGLIPAGGGCKELALRLSRALPADADLQPGLNRIFETIGMAKVSTSAHDAVRLGLLRATDRIVMNDDHRVYEAKQEVLRLANSDYMPHQPERIRVVGSDGKAVMQLGAHQLRLGDYISDHDLLIAQKLAHVLAGGDVPAGTLVTEQYMLDLEREAFLSLCGEPKTQQRMQHMLATGKPLRN